MRNLKKWGQSALSHVTFGNCILFAFVLAQLCDGLFTYLAVRKFGVQAEANPVVALAITVMGAEIGLIYTKAVALFCGMLLTLAGVHHIVAGLTILYLVAAILPWVAVFSRV